MLLNDRYIVLMSGTSVDGVTLPTGMTASAFSAMVEAITPVLP